MSEEEIKKNIDEIIDNYNTFLDDEEFGDYYEREWAEFELKTITAFLDLYNKEKEKNKELQNRVVFLSRISGMLSTDTIIEEE